MAKMFCCLVPHFFSQMLLTSVKWYKTFLVLQYDGRLNKVCVICAALKFCTVCNSWFVGTCLDSRKVALISIMVNSVVTHSFTPRELHMATFNLAHVFNLTDKSPLHPLFVQGGSNMTGTDWCVNKPHCAAAVRP